MVKYILHCLYYITEMTSNVNSISIKKMTTIYFLNVIWFGNMFKLLIDNIKYY